MQDEIQGINWAGAAPFTLFTRTKKQKYFQLLGSQIMLLLLPVYSENQIAVLLIQEFSYNTAKSLATLLIKWGGEIYPEAVGTRFQFWGRYGLAQRSQIEGEANMIGPGFPQWDKSFFYPYPAKSSVCS